MWKPGPLVRVVWPRTWTGDLELALAPEGYMVCRVRVRTSVNMAWVPLVKHCRVMFFANIVSERGCSVYIIPVYGPRLDTHEHGPWTWIMCGWSPIVVGLKQLLSVQRFWLYLYYVFVACREDQFKCHNTDRCIPASWTCNSVNDCGDWSDEEENCSKR